MTIISHRRAFISCIAGCIAAAGLTVSGIANAQSWPTKPVRVVVPVGAGGTTDMLARILADALQKSTGQPFIVDLKPGASGAVAAQDVIRQPPDGHTLYLGTVSQNGVGMAVLPNLGYSNADFTPIARLVDANIVLTASAKLNVKTIKELVELARTKPGAINYYSTGVGSYAHLVAEMLATHANVKMTHIPYKGLAQGYPDLASGITHLAHDAIASSLPYIKDGSLRALAVTGPKRSPALPDVPTIGEALTQLGLPPYSTTVWFGLFGPRGMSPELARRVSDEFNKVLKSPDIVNRLANLYVEPAATTPPEFASYVNADVERWRKVARDANFKPD